MLIDGRTDDFSTLIVNKKYILVNAQEKRHVNTDPFLHCIYTV